jgi:hypothetical protein
MLAVDGMASQESGGVVKVARLGSVTICALVVVTARVGCVSTNSEGGGGSVPICTLMATKATRHNTGR